jgi:hypothetical protein
VATGAQATTFNLTMPTDARIFGIEATVLHQHINVTALLKIGPDTPSGVERSCGAMGTGHYATWFTYQSRTLLLHAGNQEVPSPLHGDFGDTMRESLTLSPGKTLRLVVAIKDAPKLLDSLNAESHAPFRMADLGAASLSCIWGVDDMDGSVTAVGGYTHAQDLSASWTSQNESEVFLVYSASLDYDMSVTHGGAMLWSDSQTGATTARGADHIHNLTLPPGESRLDVARFDGDGSSSLTATWLGLPAGFLEEDAVDH